MQMCNIKYTPTPGGRILSLSRAYKPILLRSSTPKKLALPHGTLLLVVLSVRSLLLTALSQTHPWAPGSRAPDLAPEENIES